MPTPSIDPATLLVEAERNTFALDTVSFQMKMEMDIESDDVSISMDFDASGAADGNFETLVLQSANLDMELDI
ncbi:MAG: hypothetical protein ACE5KI_06040, partial [Dehalococcoidia bacterium]